MRGHTEHILSLATKCSNTCAMFLPREARERLRAHAGPLRLAVFNMNAQFLRRAQTEPPLSVREMQNTLEIQTSAKAFLRTAGLLC